MSLPFDPSRIAPDDEAWAAIARETGELVDEFFERV
jgi:hypothetical protein